MPKWGCCELVGIFRVLSYYFDISCSHLLLNEYERGNLTQMHSTVTVCNSLLLCFHK
jgi:hypothetical protein